MEPEPESGSLSPGSTEAPGRSGKSMSRWRVSLATLMLMVLTAALGVATFVKVRLQFDPVSTEATDLPAVFVIAVALTGLAIGGARRYTTDQTLIHISTAYAVVTSGILFAEMSDRLALYWLEIVVAATIAVPFTVQALLLGARRRERCEKRRIKRWVELLILAHLNIGLAFVGTLASAQAAELFNGMVAQARERAKR